MTSWKNNYLMPLRRVQKAGAVSLIKFSTQDAAYDSNQRIASTREIGAGVYDAYFEEAADAVKEFGAPVFISINHEMNGNWYPYSEDAGKGATAADYIASWRRIVDIFRRRGADNAAFVWSPNVPDVGAVSFTKYYPGDSYVDWVGVSFYSGNPMSNLKTVYDTYAARKPIFITEWATSTRQNAYYKGFPGEAEWIDDFFAKRLKTITRECARFPGFNGIKDDGNHLLQRVPQQAQAYQADIKKARYLDKRRYAAGRRRKQQRRVLAVRRWKDAPQEIVLHGKARHCKRPKTEIVKVENPRPTRPKLRIVPRSN